MGGGGQSQERAVSWATWLKSDFQGHLVHPQPPPFCDLQASKSPNETPRHPTIRRCPTPPLAKAPLEPACSTQTAFLGHIVESEGNKGLFVTRKSRRTWSVATVSLHLAVLTGFRGHFGQKKAVFGAQNVQFWEGTSRRPRPGAPLVRILLVVTSYPIFSHHEPFMGANTH